MSDVPAQIDDDALCSHELSESVFTCIRSMSEDQKGEIIRQLEDSQMECDEAFSTLGTFGCDLLEVCCNEDSTLTATIIQEGGKAFGKAFRIGLGNNMGLSTPQGLERAIVLLLLWLNPVGCGFLFIVVPLVLYNILTRKRKSRLGT